MLASVSGDAKAGQGKKQALCSRFSIDGIVLLSAIDSFSRVVGNWPSSGLSFYPPPPRFIEL